tara:strand:+ start:2729 stop:3172 length:444 start_codon:yes stop_codon:yes gene_type:complete
MVVAHWIDHQGSAQEIGTILPGQIVQITTFPGHVTVFSAGGRQLSTFEATASSDGAAYGISGTVGVANDPVVPEIAVCWSPPPEVVVCFAPPPPLSAPPKSGGGSKNRGGTGNAPPVVSPGPSNPPVNNANAAGDIATVIQFILQNL